MIQEHEPPKEKETAPSHITESDVLAPEEQSLLKEVERHPKVISILASRHHQGPLPTPEDLAHYNTIIPNGAERIMRMAEKEQAHRIELNKNEQVGKFEYLKAETALKSNGQWFAVGTILLFAILSGMFVYHAQYIYAFWIMTGSLVAIVAIFVTGKYIERNQTDDDE